MCVCCGSSLISDLPSAVWPDLQIIYALITFLIVIFVSCCSIFSSLSPFNCGIKAKIVMDIMWQSKHELHGETSERFEVNTISDCQVIIFFSFCQRQFSVSTRVLDVGR